VASLYAVLASIPGNFIWDLWGGGHWNWISLDFDFPLLIVIPPSCKAPLSLELQVRAFVSHPTLGRTWCRGCNVLLLTLKQWHPCVVGIWQEISLVVRAVSRDT
jgi:hypothetical protein